MIERPSSMIIECPYCEEYTPLTGPCFVENINIGGRDKCRNCDKMFQYDFSIVNTVIKTLT